jgi:hypothetical protein
MADDLNDFLQTHKRREGTMSRGDADKPEQTHIGSMIIIMMGCEGGGRERICTALPCFATSRRSRAMKMSIIRKGVILVACLTAMGAWTAPSKAASQSFKVTLNGAQQVPPVQTAATGTAELTYDPATRVLTWTLNYSGLSGPATMAHFHGPAAAGKNGPPVIWLSPKGSPVQAPVKGEATLTPEQAQQFSAGEWYINVHTQDHQAGEIRGQVMPPKS